MSSGPDYDARFLYKKADEMATNELKQRGYERPVKMPDEPLDYGLLKAYDETHASLVVKYLSYLSSASA